MKRHGLARARRECCGFATQHVWSEEMDFDLFGPSSESPSAQLPTTAAQVPGSGSAPTGAPVQLPVPPTPTLGADQLLMLQMLNNQNTALQQQQNQMNFLMQAQSAQLTLLNRRLDEEARRKAEEARRTVSADSFAAASAGSGSGATVPAPTGSPVAPPSVPASVVTSGGFFEFWWFSSTTGR